jgi:hypothetical protein
LTIEIPDRNSDDNDNEINRSVLSAVTELSGCSSFLNGSNVEQPSDFLLALSQEETADDFLLDYARGSRLPKISTNDNDNTSIVNVSGCMDVVAGMSVDADDDYVVDATAKAPMFDAEKQQHYQQLHEQQHRKVSPNTTPSADKAISSTATTMIAEDWNRENINHISTAIVRLPKDEQYTAANDTANADANVNVNTHGIIDSTTSDNAASFHTPSPSHSHTSTTSPYLSTSTSSISTIIPPTTTSPTTSTTHSATTSTSTAAHNITPSGVANLWKNRGGISVSPAGWGKVGNVPSSTHSPALGNKIDLRKVRLVNFYFITYFIIFFISAICTGLAMRSNQ